MKTIFEMKENIYYCPIKNRLIISSFNDENILYAMEISSGKTYFYFLIGEL